MHVFHGERTCTVNISTYLPKNYRDITYNTVAQMLAEELFIEEIRTIQITTCHRYISICFNTRDSPIIFCESQHEILPDTFIKFEPDYQEKTRISIENIPIELPDKGVKTFLAQSAQPVGKTYYP